MGEGSRESRAGRHRQAVSTHMATESGSEKCVAWQAYRQAGMSWAWGRLAWHVPIYIERQSRRERQKERA